MRGLTLLFLISVVALAGSYASANDGKSPDSLLIGRVEVESGSGVALEIHFFNDEPLAALTIPVSLAGGGYKIDSISFAGSRVEYLSMRPVTIKENKKDVVFGAIVMTEDYIPAGKGLMATMYLSSAGGKQAETTVVDTTTIGPASVLFTKTSSASFVPKVVPGMISAKKAGKTEAEKPEKAEKEDKKDKAAGGDDN